MSNIEPNRFVPSEISPGHLDAPVVRDSDIAEDRMDGNERIRIVAAMFAGAILRQRAPDVAAPEHQDSLPTALEASRTLGPDGTVG